MNLIKKKFLFAAITLVIGMLLLNACELPFVVISKSDSYQMTIVALEATSTALQLAANGGISGSTPASTEQVVVIENPTATVQIVHSLMPSEPGANRESTMTDADTSSHASEKRSAAGENFSSGFFERPFNAQTMDVYYPELDILQAWLNHDSTWVYVMIRVAGSDSNGTLGGSYGAEFDLDLDGRGDILVFVKSPASSWSVEGVEVWQDKNNDVGHIVPKITDPPQGGDGYETRLFNAGQGNDADLAWARIDPANPQVVQIALKYYSALGNDAEYMWGAWTQDVFHPEWFDYNDHFTIDEAGSPLTTQSQYYPLKALAAVDNTCRWVVGFSPTGSEPGICSLAATPTPQPTNTPLPLPGTVTGVVYYDMNGNGSRQTGEYGLPNATVGLYSGSCSGSLVASGTTNSSGSVSFSGITPGTYCLRVTSAPPGGYTATSGTGPITFTLGSAETYTGYLPYTIYIY
jgi:hypothetical protein